MPSITRTPGFCRPAPRRTGPTRPCTPAATGSSRASKAASRAAGSGSARAGATPCACPGTSWCWAWLPYRRWPTARAWRKRAYAAGCAVSSSWGWPRHGCPPVSHLPPCIPSLAFRSALIRRAQRSPANRLLVPTLYPDRSRRQQSQKWSATAHRDSMDVAIAILEIG